MIATIGIMAVLLLAVFYLIGYPLSALYYLRVIYPRIMRGRKGDPRFSVHVIVPCKGDNGQLRENLRAIAAQDHPRAVFTFVTDTENDAARPAIDAVVRENKRARHIAPGYSQTCAQKNFVQLSAVGSDPESDIFVVCDSDMRPAPDWLRRLVDPFANPEVSVTGTTRWILPSKPGIGPCTYTALTGYYATMLATPFNPPIVWGGCFALSRTAWERMGIAEIWSRTASDDLTLAQKMKEHGIRPVFVPDAVSASHEVHATLKNLFAWYKGQAVTGRIHVPGSWAAILFIETFVCLATLASLGLLAAEAAVSRVDANAVLLLAVPLLVMANGLLVKLPYRSRRDMSLGWWVLVPFFGHAVVAASYWRSITIRTFTWGRTTYEFNRDRTVRKIIRREKGGAA